MVIKNSCKVSKFRLIVNFFYPFPKVAFAEWFHRNSDYLAVPEVPENLPF